MGYTSPTFEQEESGLFPVMSKDMPESRFGVGAQADTGFGPQRTFQENYSPMGPTEPTIGGVKAEGLGAAQPGQQLRVDLENLQRGYGAGDALAFETKVGAGADLGKDVPEEAVSDGGFDIMGASQIGAGVVSDLVQNNANQVANKYQQQLAQWKAEDKYWFDPNADLAPNLEGYLGEMPSSMDALMDARMLDFESEGLQNTAQYMADPGTMSVKFLADLTGNKEAGEAIGYAAESGNEGAVAGFASGGWVGAIVGGLIGIAEGFFGYSAAKDEDKEKEKVAKRKHEKALKEWTSRKNKRIYQANRVASERRQLKSQASREKATNKKKQKSADITAQRDAMVQSLMSGNTLGKQATQERVARWR